MKSINKLYWEDKLGNFTDLIHTDLTLLLSSQWNFFEETARIKISKDTISYARKEKLNTVNSVLLLLAVASSPYDDVLLQEKWIIYVPEDVIFKNIQPNKWGDLLHQVVLTGKWYALYRSYNILVNKLKERDTPLFRLLFICTCLGLWKQNISPELIGGPICAWLHWWNLIMSMTDDFSEATEINYAFAWYGSFISYVKEVVNRISEWEMPDIILQHLFQLNNNTWTNKNALLVQQAINQVIRFN